MHTLACFPLAAFGTDEQRDRWLPDMVGGELLGAYCLSEPESGSDAAAMTTRAVRDGDDYVVNGTKAWITHGGEADFYALMCRTSDDGARGHLLPARRRATRPGSRPPSPSTRWASRASTTAQVRFDDAHIGADRLMGAEGQGFKIALAALDGGRLGIAACAVGLAQAALDVGPGLGPGARAVRPRRSSSSRGCRSCSPTWPPRSRRPGRCTSRRPGAATAGEPFGKQAAMAKLFCTDMAMRVTTDAVQVLGGYGYVEDYPVERYMREAKALQIVEGTNQIQRMVIGRPWLAGQ